MTALTATRKLKFDAGHRVMNHESKCRNAHGHEYIVMVTAKARNGLDALGRIIDFSVLKSVLGEWLDEKWDHGFIVYDKDAEMINALEQVEGQKLYKLPFNPTAENMAEYLLKTICPKLFDGFGIIVTAIEVHETENCYAKAEL